MGLVKIGPILSKKVCANLRTTSPPCNIGFSVLMHCPILRVLLSSALTTNRKHRMKKQIAYAMTLLLATSALSFAGPDKDAMMAKEKAAW